MATALEDRIDLLDLPRDELEAPLRRWGEPRFRAQQIWHWLYSRLVDTPEAMHNLPKALRQRLLAETTVGGLEPLDRLRSEDGLTEKVLLLTADGQLLETVLMRHQGRNTVCASSQIGCSLGCVFCATGRAGFVRNLRVGEIVEQLLFYARLLRAEGAAVTNVVLMGMGEPLLNLDAVLQAIANLNHPEGLGLGMRRFTLSTAGVVPGIERLAREATGVGLAVSLHAPDDALRSRLMPINRRYPLASLLTACRWYTDSTGRRVTFEYALVDGLNDSDEHARRTAELLQGMLCHVNLIPVNPVDGDGDAAGARCEPPPQERVLRFQRMLAEAHIETTVRASRGADIRAACGQLRGRRPNPRP